MKNLTQKQHERLLNALSKSAYSPVDVIERVLSGRIMSEGQKRAYDHALMIATFPEDLKALRAKAGLSQAQASAFLKIPKRSIQNWEQGVNIADSFKIESVMIGLREFVKKNDL